jgi:hypothetical protein
MFAAAFINGFLGQNGSMILVNTFFKDHFLFVDIEPLSTQEYSGYILRMV